jgi:hypothetical protein
MSLYIAVAGMETQLHQTREAWLNYVAQRMAPMFEKLGTFATGTVAYRDWIHVKRPAQQEHRRVLG